MFLFSSHKRIVFTFFVGLRFVLSPLIGEGVIVIGEGLRQLAVVIFFVH